MKTIFFGLLFFCAFSIQAQVELKKQSVDSGGAIVQSGNISLLFTVGEVVVAESTSGVYTISEGFIGREINLPLGIDNFEELIGVKVYPNPVADQLYINFPDLENYSIQLFSTDGKLLQEVENQQKQEVMINLSSYNLTGFILVIKTVYTQKVKVFKLLTQ